MFGDVHSYKMFLYVEFFNFNSNFELNFIQLNTYCIYLFFLCQVPFCSSKDKDNGKIVYDMYIAHETIRITVIKPLTQNNNRFKLNEVFYRKMVDYFLANFKSYKKICEKYTECDGKSYGVSILCMSPLGPFSSMTGGRE